MERQEKLNGKYEDKKNKQKMKSSVCAPCV